VNNVKDGEIVFTFFLRGFGIPQLNLPQNPVRKTWQIFQIFLLIWQNLRFWNTCQIFHTGLGGKQT